MNCYRKEVLVSSDPQIYRLQHIYAMAVGYLEDNAPVSRDELKRYFDIKKTYTTKNEILYVLFGSLQNRNQMANVIGFGTQKKNDVFKNIFYDYDGAKILAVYETDDNLFRHFTSLFPIRNQESKDNLWRKYSKFIFSACRFMEKFNTAEDFTEFVERFIYNELSAAALPLVLSREVDGLGFALACDWLKDLGFSEYPKPDVHIIEIFYKSGLCENTDYSAYKAVIKMARATGDTPFNIDRTFWLIASGKYYLHDKKIPSGKEEIIEIILSTEE